MIKLGDLVVRKNGEWGWLERVTHPGYDVAWIRDATGFVSTCNLAGVRHPCPEKDWEICYAAKECTDRNDDA